MTTDACGEHDIIFSFEKWYALNQQLPTPQLLTFPRADHGLQHQHPEAAAEHICTVVGTASRCGTISVTEQELHNA